MTEITTLPHHEVKALIGINVLDEIVHIFTESQTMIPRKFVNIVENTLHVAKKEAIQNYNKSLAQYPNPPLVTASQSVVNEDSSQENNNADSL